MLNGSDWREQKTGIRQGCPLSPYQFLVLMTVLFKLVYQEAGVDMVMQRPDELGQDGVLYADDTVCFGTDVRQLHKFVAIFEKVACTFGLSFNRGNAPRW